MHEKQASGYRKPVSHLPKYIYCDAAISSSKAAVCRLVLRLAITDSSWFGRTVRRKYTISSQRFPSSQMGWG